MSRPGVLLAGRYRLVSVIATGGMGVVWKGWDERLDRAVAVKQLRPAPGIPEAEAALAKDRAMREARITGRLQHPHAVSVFDAVEHEGQPCLVMPFLESTTLSAVLREGPPPTLGQVARIGAEVGSALAAAHRLGIVHRDVKPGNILITADGAAHISDFGISHALGDVTLTGTGWIHGTPAYLAPEVARGDAASFPSDVFSLGATLYAALEGAPPFGTDTNAIALLHKVAAGSVPPPERAGPLTPFLLEMLSSDPQARPTMDLVASVLADYTTYARVEEQPVAGAEATEALAHPGGETEPTPPPVAPEDAGTGLSSWFPRESTSPGPTEEAGRPPPAEPPRPVPASATRESERDLVAPRVVGSGAASATDRERPSRALLLVGAALVAVLLVVGAAALLGDLGRDPSGVAARTPAPAASDEPTSDSGPSAASGAQPTSAQPTGTPSASATETGDRDRSETEPERSSAPETEPARASESTAERETTPPPETESRPPAADRATELASAINDYYALMPGNRDEGWDRMTADYQTNHAGGFDSYDSFWSEITDVTVSDVEATPPDQVVATLTYSFADGRVAVERTAYRLADEEGVLKIAASEVLSSRSG